MLNLNLLSKQISVWSTHVEENNSPTKGISGSAFSVSTSKSKSKLVCRRVCHNLVTFH